MTHDQIYSRILEILSDTFDVDASRVTRNSQLGADLDIDSIDAVDLIVQLKPMIGSNLRPEAFKSVRTVGDVVEVVHSMMHATA
jgi:acyl carrier protein